MKMHTCAAVNVALSGVAGLLLAQPSALASGFAIPEMSALGTALANAVVANPEQPGAFAYNPSAMGFHDRSSAALGAILVEPKFEVTTASGTNEGIGARWIPLPIFQVALKVHDQWRLGIGASAPFGLETEWSFGTFPDLSESFQSPTGLTLPTGSHPTTTSLEILAVTPSLAYRVSDDLSLAVGLDYYKAREGRFDSQLAKLTGDGAAFGWNASLLYRRDAWSLGLSFHSSATIDVDGWYRPLDPTLAQLGELQASQSASLDLNLPWRLQLGARYKLTEALAVELDWSRTGWSEFDRVEVASASGALLASESNQWRDVNAYRIGITYDVRPQTQLRFGYSYDETGQGEREFSARIPDSDRHLFAVGLGQDLGQGWALEAAYMYVKLDERRIRNAIPYTPGGDAIGSDAYNGDYDSSANLVALEVSKTF